MNDATTGLGDEQNVAEAYGGGDGATWTLGDHTLILLDGSVAGDEGTHRGISWSKAVTTLR